VLQINCIKTKQVEGNLLLKRILKYLLLKSTHLADELSICFIILERPMFDSLDVTFSMDTNYSKKWNITKPQTNMKKH